MFHRYSKKGTGQAKPLKDLTRILTVEEVLSDEKRALLLEQIRTTCALEKSRFDSLCLSIIHNLVNHAQNLPETSNSYYSQPGGLLDYALNRTEAALNLFKKFVLLEENADYSEEQRLWQYALFSAALLQGIGKLQIDYLVELYDNNGQFLKLWNPLLENLVSIGSHYNYSFQKEGDIDLRRRLNILLARTLMPTSGFSWIVSNTQVLAVWLALLNEDPYSAGTLGAILIRADAIALQRYLNQLNFKPSSNKHNRYGRAGTFTGFVPESISELEQQIGIQFIQWLTKSLESRVIMINKAPLFMVPGGLLMSPEIFKWFVREHPEYKNWQAAQNGFLSLKLHQVGPDGNPIARFEQTNTKQMQSGIIFSHYAVALPASVQFYNLNTGKTATLSDIETIHLSQFSSNFTAPQQTNVTTSLEVLNAAGQWQQANILKTPDSKLNSGLTSRG
ncbi:conjugal transfer nickase/helicase domain-containing protein [Legionella sp. CNM-1927-20]|uniref:conjugal transfer nickase/helicase domain-containing protein n=1 Tax=Legionella sp. CNM-1927-20 TaxID=3422221 RepID=UPI00403AAC1F